MSTSVPVDDMDDIYGTPSANNTPTIHTAQATSYVDAKQLPEAHSHIAGIPGLGSFPPQSPSAPSQPQTEQLQGVAQPEVAKLEEEAILHSAPQDHPTELLVEQPAAATIPAEIAVEVEVVSAPVQAARPDATSALFDALGNNDELNKNLPTPIESESEPASTSVPAAEPVTASTSTKPRVDPEFLEAAEAQKGAEGAEWQYDSSDAESSDESSSSDDSSSDEDSDEEGYELLDPATAARMLMEEGGMDDEEGGSKAGNGSQLRTKNEVPEEVVPKPDVTVTPDMKITPLGAVQHVVDTLILIKAFTSGEYQVLESGSVLCLENREVIGAVQDTIGKVEEPLYSVAFTRPSDISDLNIATNTKIFYVDSHSTYVFTQPLKNLKGTDASNLHDEEVADEEMEFSDDEAEAAYKRAKKEAKKGARAARDQPNQAPVAKPYTGGAMNYDDEPEAEEMYTPLARPDNLQDMMTNGAPPARRQFAERGGRGRGRGRGNDRGRGDRGRGGRGGGRGGADNANQRKGPSNSYPDTHNAGAPAYAQQLPQKPAVPQQQMQQMPQMPQMQQMWNQAQPQMSGQFAFPQFNQQQFPPPPPPPQTQSPFPNMQFAWPPNPQFFNQGQQQQPSYNQGQQQQQPYQFPGAPAGAFVNPAFFQQQQQMQQPQQQQQQQAPAVSAQNDGPTPEQIQAAADLWRRLQQQQQ
ncbi:NAF1-domain-containing protein [Aureobasidium sp. EXF-12298]|nr:NAF1-domain-containing protein [Aureobasidium sp. EXF-12298]